MPIYNCKHSGDQYLITKFSSFGDVQSSYLCDHVHCQCPAGVRDTCRHRLMLPTFLEQGLVNTNLFLDWDRGRHIVDFNGLPAIPPQQYEDPEGDGSEEQDEHDLAPQALTDTGAQSNQPATHTIASYIELPADADVAEEFGKLLHPKPADPQPAITYEEDPLEYHPTKPWRRF